MSAESAVQTLNESIFNSIEEFDLSETFWEFNQNFSNDNKQFERNEFRLPVQQACSCISHYVIHMQPGSFLFYEYWSAKSGMQSNWWQASRLTHYEQYTVCIAHTLKLFQGFIFCEYAGSEFLESRLSMHSKSGLQQVCSGLFDRLPEHSVVQRLEIFRKSSNERFLLLRLIQMNHLTYLS